MTKQLVIKDVMEKPATISKSAKITEALDKMLETGADPLIALNGNSVVGTVSRQAIARKLGSKQNSADRPLCHPRSERCRRGVHERLSRRECQRARAAPPAL